MNLKLFLQINLNSGKEKSYPEQNVEGEQQSCGNQRKTHGRGGRLKLFKNSMETKITILCFGFVYKNAERCLLSVAEPRFYIERGDSLEIPQITSVILLITAKFGPYQSKSTFSYQIRLRTESH